MSTSFGLGRRLPRFRLFFLAVLAVVGVVAPLAFGAAPVQAARVPMHSGSYAYFGDGDPMHRLTATVRPSRMNAPWVVVIHGGSWVHGTQRNVANAARMFASNGFQVFNVSYRLDGVNFAEQTRDLLAAIRWVRGHAARFGLDLHRGTVYGFSAGGQLATWLGGTGYFRTVVSISGVLQPQRVAQDAAGLRPATEPATRITDALAAAERHIVGCPFISADRSCQEKWRNFEPQFRLNRKFPAMFLAQGQADPVVPPATAPAFAYWLGRHHIAHELIKVPGFEHTDQVLFASRERKAEMLRFVAEHSR